GRWPHPTPTRSEPVISRYLPLTLAALTLSACNDRTVPGGSAGEGTPVQGGTAIISRVSDFDAFNQFVSTDYDTGQVLRYMLFMPRVRLDADFEYEPYLAESFEMAEDGLSLTFRIRDGVRWHDGTPVTAADV